MNSAAVLSAFVHALEDTLDKRIDECLAVVDDLDAANAAGVLAQRVQRDMRLVAIALAGVRRAIGEAARSIL